jgi:hypothetical protein
MKKRIPKINKAAKCNIQTEHTARIMTALQSARLPANVVATLPTAGISLIDVLDARRITHPLCVVTPHTMRYCSEMSDQHLRELARSSIRDESLIATRLGMELPAQSEELSERFRI